MEAWIFVYTAGAVGGLVFELIRGRGGVEFPSVEGLAGPRFGQASQTSVAVGNGGEPPAAAPLPTPAPAGGLDASSGSTLVPASATSLSVAPPAAHFVPETTAPNGMDMADTTGAPRGGRTYIGFLARVTMGGLAASAMLVLVQIISGRTDPTSFTETALRLDTLAGAALVGMVAPALWTGIQTISESRFSFLKGTMDTAAVAVANAEQAVKTAQETALVTSGQDVSQFIVDAASLRSPEFIATLAREEDPTEVGKMLLARINSSRIDLATTQAHVEAQLGQALGSLEAAQRVLRAANLRANRR
jgi:hypothetical protein